MVSRLKIKSGRIGIGISMVLLAGFLTVANNPHTNTVAAAGTSTLSLSPASGSYTVGNNFTVTVYENSGGNQANSVTARIKYNPAVLQYVGNDSAASSAFTTEYNESHGTAGVFEVTRGQSGTPVIGNNKVVSVTFKALTATAGSAITFDNATADTNMIVGPPTFVNQWNGSPTGGTYSFVAATPPPSAPPASSGGSTGSTGSTSPRSGGSSPSAPRSSGSGTSSGSSSGSSTEPSTSTPEAPGETSTSQEPQESEGPPAKTAFVAIKIVDENNKVVKGAKVTLEDGQTATTDETGVASFVNVKPGEYSVEVSHDGKTVTQKITLKDPSSIDGPNLQSFNVKLASNKQGNKANTTTVSVALLLMVVVAAVLFFLPHRRKPVFGALSDAPHENHVQINESNQPNQIITPTTVAPTMPQLPTTPTSTEPPEEIELKTPIVTAGGTKPQSTGTEKPDSELTLQELEDKYKGKTQ